MEHLGFDKKGSSSHAKPVKKNKGKNNNSEAEAESESESAEQSDMETETEKEQMDIKNEMEEEGITSSNDDSKTSADGGDAVAMKTSTIMVNTTSPMTRA